MCAVRGAGTTAPFGTVAGGGGAYTRLHNPHYTTVPAPVDTTDLTPVEADALGLVVAVCVGVRLTPTIDGASGWSSVNSQTSTAGTDATVAVANKAFTTPAVLDNPTITFASAGSPGVSTGFLFALVPPAPAGPVTQRWTGSAWTTAAVQRWDGSASVPATVTIQ